MDPDDPDGDGDQLSSTAPQENPYEPKGVMTANRAWALVQKRIA